MDTWSRVDLAPVSELWRTSDQSVVMELERGDFTALQETGRSPPEAFVAKGRWRRLRYNPSSDRALPP